MSAYKFFSFDDLFDVIEDIRGTFSDYTGDLKKWFPEGMLSDSFPPCDIMIDKDKNLCIKFAIAGYDKEQISLTYEKDHLLLKLEPTKEEEEGYQYLKTGIRRSSSQTKVFVPSNLYNASSISSKLSNGMLTVKVEAKKKEEAPINSIKIETT